MKYKIFFKQVYYGGPKKTNNMISSELTNKRSYLEDFEVLTMSGVFPVKFLIQIITKTNRLFFWFDLSDIQKFHPFILITFHVQIFSLINFTSFSGMYIFRNVYRQNNGIIVLVKT